MKLPTLAVTVFAFQALVACALHHRNRQEKTFYASQWNRTGSSTESWPSRLHFPWSGIWPWSHRRCGENVCGLLAGSPSHPVRVNCTQGDKWMAPEALFVPGRGGKNAIYCPVPKAATSMMFGVMENLSLSNGEERTNGYRTVGEMVHNEDEGDTAKLCEAHSFVIIRNPWDRIVSAYVDKVLTLETTSYRMKFHKFMSELDAANASLLNRHFKPASLECNTVGEHRQKYDSVMKLEDNLNEQVVDVLTRYLSIPEAEVRRAIDAADTHSSSKGAPSKYDESIDSGLDKTTYYFRQSDPEIVRRVYRDDIEFGEYDQGF